MLKQDGALKGLKIVEFAHVIAGPLAGTLMADLGATVVHVEDPGAGDPQRTAGPDKDGVHLWWQMAGRNKHSVTLNLRSDAGRKVAEELAAWADVVITNFRVETLEKWGLDFASLNRINPKIIMLQVTGFGATSSRRNEPGFGKVGEAMSGVVNLTGFPDGPPVHTGFSHGDSVTGLMGAYAVQAALYRKHTDPDFRGEWIDLALYDGLFRLIEWQVVFHDQLGEPPQRMGNKLAAAPAAVINMYKTADDRWLTVTSGTPRAVLNTAKLVGEPEDMYSNRADQARNADRLDKLLAEWIASRGMDECMAAMKAIGVVASPIYTVADILEDETFKERESVIELDVPRLGKVKMQNVFPRMMNYTGAVWRAAPPLGADNELVYKSFLGKSDEQLAALRDGADI
ncbi:CaiB/BaiF CoA transferase family protein [Chelatococcus asaccharovorans]|uniref:Formyl-CoA transferase n=1 Tax=Chelatococcus asaccharovorans TaxID=28210 RepID=A0A2V3UB66_9HYPH|nr:CoA transferase [Chelatococcus asaccharovorans]MBS7705477.1 CoA transferase [Chelatococcus asaccharovorans]PXW60118.1 formyl-CoA transferase [Chelatococcus asaccharovorans]